MTVPEFLQKTLGSRSKRIRRPNSAEIFTINPISRTNYFTLHTIYLSICCTFVIEYSSASPLNRCNANWLKLHKWKSVTLSVANNFHIFLLFYSYTVLSSTYMNMCKLYIQLVWVLKLRWNFLCTQTRWVLL